MCVYVCRARVCKADLQAHAFTSKPFLPSAKASSFLSSATNIKNTRACVRVPEWVCKSSTKNKMWFSQAQDQVNANAVQKRLQCPYFSFIFPSYFFFSLSEWSLKSRGYIYVYMRGSPLSTPSWHMYRYVILPLSLCTALYSYVTWLPKSWLILPLEIVCQIDRYGYLNTKWWFPESMLVDLILITNVYLVCIVLTQNWKG